MANGTRSPFLVESRNRNRFLPFIQDFTNYMHKYMDAQSNLAEKMYAFDKKQQGEKFISDYGTRLRGAGTPEEISTIMGEATQFAGSRGLSSHLPIIGSLAQTQGNLVKLEQDKKQAAIFSDVYTSSYGDETVTYNGQETKVSSAIQDINNKTTDPATRLALINQVVKGCLLVILILLCNLMDKVKFY